MMTIIIQSWGNLQTYWVRSGHLAEVSVCHIWMHSLSELNAPCKSSTVARWDSKQKENWSRHTLPLASLAVPRQEILPLIVKWRSRIREQSLHSVLWCSAPESSAMEPVARANWHACTHTRHLHRLRCPIIKCRILDIIIYLSLQDFLFSLVSSKHYKAKPQEIWSVPPSSRAQIFPVRMSLKATFLTSLFVHELGHFSSKATVVTITVPI